MIIIVQRVHRDQNLFFIDRRGYGGMLCIFYDVIARSQNSKWLIVFPAFFPACPTAYLARPSSENVTINRFDLNFGFITGDRLSRQHYVDVGMLRVIPVILQDLEAFRRSLFAKRFPANILVSASRLLLIRAWLNTSRASDEAETSPIWTERNYLSI